MAAASAAGSFAGLGNTDRTQPAAVPRFDAGRPIGAFRSRTARRRGAPSGMTTPAAISARAPQREGEDRRVRVFRGDRQRQGQNCRAGEGPEEIIAGPSIYDRRFSNIAPRPETVQLAGGIRKGSGRHDLISCYWKRLIRRGCEGRRDGQHGSGRRGRLFSEGLQPLPAGVQDEAYLRKSRPPGVRPDFLNAARSPGRALWRRSAGSVFQVPNGGHWEQDALRQVRVEPG